MSQAVEQLQQLGFSQYEAQAYVSLLERNPLNGYELAKASGIPRANIYSILKKLEERGVVIRLDTAEGIYYAPIPAKEILQRLNRQFDAILASADHSLNEISARTRPAYVWNAHGYTTLVEHARAMIDSAADSLLLAVCSPEAALISSSLQQAETRGVQITTLCLENCQHPCPACRGQIFLRSFLPPQTSRWLIVIQEQRELLAGEIATDTDTLMIRTQQKLLVELASSSIRHSIALAALLTQSENRRFDHLDAQTQNLFTSLGLEGHMGDLYGVIRSIQPEN